MNGEAQPFQGWLDPSADRHAGPELFFGGATAIEMARVDPRVKAAINHDGNLFGGAMHQPVGRPFMLFHDGLTTRPGRRKPIGVAPGDAEGDTGRPPRGTGSCQGRLV